MYPIKKLERWILSVRESGQGRTCGSSRPSVGVLHRRMRQKVDVDCIAVQKVRENTMYTPRKRNYTESCARFSKEE